MKTLFDHINHIKGKPHHVRKRIAFGTAMGGTALIAFIWIGVSLSTGAFAIHSTPFAQSAQVVAGTDTSNQNLAGAAAAQQTTQTAPAQIQIIDAASSTQQAEQTTIPF